MWCFCSLQSSIWKHSFYFIYLCYLDFISSSNWILHKLISTLKTYYCYSSSALLIYEVCISRLWWEILRTYNCHEVDLFWLFLLNWIHIFVESLLFVDFHTLLFSSLIVMIRFNYVCRATIDGRGANTSMYSTPQ